MGKSSIINALMKKKCCSVAPIPGETKVWQYITMTKRIFLIDCPGIVYDTNETEEDKVLKGVVRAERLPAPEIFIQAILDRVEKRHLTDIFGVHSWTDSEDFVNQVAIRTGKLVKGGEPDINNVSKNIIFMWQQGKLPYFTKPPKTEEGAPLKTVDEIVEMAAPIDEAVEEAQQGI